MTTSRLPLLALLLLLVLGLLLPTTALGQQRAVLVADATSVAPGEPPLVTPFGLEFLADRTAVLVELTGHRLRRLGPDGRIRTLAGSGQKGDAGDLGPPRAALFNGPHGLALDAQDRIYIADTWNNRVRRYDLAADSLAPFAGLSTTQRSPDAGPSTPSANAPALEAIFGGLFAVASSPDRRTLYLVDLDGRRVHAVDFATGRLRHIAGSGARGIPADGALAVEAPLVDPRAVTAAADGTVYILERGGNALRRVDPAGRITTIAGTGRPGLTGDDGPALAATLRGPKHLCLAPDGAVIIADTANHVIRRLDLATGRLTRLAGTGVKGSSGLDGPALDLQLNEPHGVTFGPDGLLYICDSMNHRLLRLQP
jgi:sugar lactone lactonase YvrE